LKYRKELQRLERAYNMHFNTLWNMYSTQKSTLQRKFFDTVTNRVMRIFDVASRDAEHWIKSIMTPMESQIREHQLHQRRRMESIKRIHNATEELEDRIGELEHAESTARAQMLAIEAIVIDVDSLAAQTESQTTRQRTG
jgi:ubiquinone biosynthesis protein UbiJ